jgi:cyclophilin family peptidyl-prolyl cis-trans isomerase
MIRARCLRFFVLCSALVSAFSLRAQTTVPTVTANIPAQSLAPAGSATVDLKNYFGIPGVSGAVVQFTTEFGRFNVETLGADAPNTVNNFLTYVASGTYNGTLFHRTAALGGGTANGIVQGGGYTYSLPPTIVTKRSPIALEYKLPNTRGTIAMARTSDLNSATTEWFFNVADNTTVLGPSNGGGYAVFGRVLGTGLSVVDAIFALPIYNIGDYTGLPSGVFASIPLRNVVSGQTQVQLNNFVQTSNLSQVTVYPGSSGTSVLSFTVSSANSSVATGELSGSTLTVKAVGNGTTTLTVQATDTNGNQATTTVAVSVATATAPVFTTQPVAQTIASGSTVVFTAAASGSPTYQWKRNGLSIDGATTAMLVLSNATAAQAGDYTVEARNSASMVTSTTATLVVNTVATTDVSRLINLSILTTAGTGAKILTVGASVGPLNFTESLPLVMRGVGPGLRDFFGINTALADPTMAVFSASNSSAPIATNDNWGSANATALKAAFASVGAFALNDGSLDSAYAALNPGFGVGGYTVQVAGKGTASGTVIAEIYDAAGSARTATTPRLTNLSTRAQVDIGSDLRVGFVLRGNPNNPTARTVLVRAVGPSLSQFGITGVMADPKLELFDNDHAGAKIGENDNWGGDAQLTAASTSVGAFGLTGLDTKDAVLLITLPPGAYSARLSGVANSGGTAIIEVYEVP